MSYRKQMTALLLCGLILVGKVQGQRPASFPVQLSLRPCPGHASSARSSRSWRAQGKSFHSGTSSEKAQQIKSDEQRVVAAEIGTDEPGLLAHLQKQIPPQMDAISLANLIQQLGSDDFTTRVKASKTIKHLGLRAKPALLEALKSSDAETRRRARECLSALQPRKDSEVLRSVLRLLGERGSARSEKVLLEYLPFADQNVPEAQTALVQIVQRTGKVDPALLKALHHPQSLPRATAALVVGSAGKQQEEIRKLLADPDATVRLQAARGLLATKDTHAVPTVLTLLKSAPVETAWEAEEILLTLAGKSPPKVFVGRDKESRQQASQAWTQWWRKQESKLVLSDQQVQALLFHSPQQAQTIARRFLDALVSGNLQTIHATTRLPFTITQMKRHTERKTLDAWIKEVHERAAKQKIRCQVIGIEPRQKLEDRLKPDARKAFAEFGWPTLRLVHAKVVYDGKEQNERVFVVVRVVGGSARVIGVGSGTPVAREAPTK